MPTVTILGAKLVLKQLRAARFKKPYTVAIPPPWSRFRDYLAGLRPAQVSVTNAFKSAAKMTAGMALADRMEIIGDAMRGMSFGGVKRIIHPRASRAAVEAKKAEVRAAIGALR